MDSSISPKVQFLHPKEEAKYYLGVVDEMFAHLKHQDSKVVIELKEWLGELRIRAEESQEDAKAASEACVKMIKYVLDIASKKSSPQELVKQRIESIRNKKQTFDKQFQELWNLEATWGNSAKVMEIIGGNRELNSELEFLETLSKSLP